MKKKIISLLLCLLLVFMPILLCALETEEPNVKKAILHATRDAENDVSIALWMGIGCLFNIFGIGAAYLISPSPHPTRLMGKSPGYVAIYITQYKKVARTRQTTSALVGCLVISGIALIIAAANAAEESEGCSSGCTVDDPFGLNAMNDCLDDGAGCASEGNSCLEGGSGCIDGDK